jgi:uncharacterized protein (TIGR00251 family)
VARLLLKVQPRAKTTELSGRAGDTYRLRLNAPPVDGRANDECVRYLAELLGVPRARIRIVAGLTSRIKIIEIDGVTQAFLESRLPK